MGGVIVMQVQKGLVKYKDRSDIVCSYGLTEDGKQYYFLDDEKLNNGGTIASTALVEAIDHQVVPSSIGVIGVDGNIIIPFENKSVRPIYGKALLVERANPLTQSVIDAINLRKDPLSATKLVSTPAMIKDKMNQQMGEGGRFLFNDQFSEATVCDLDGNNLVDNEYYSFIALKNDVLYLSKNVMDSPVVTYDLNQDDHVQEEVINSDQNSFVQEVEEDLDVRDAKVDQDVIEHAIENNDGIAEEDVVKNILHPVRPQAISSTIDFSDETNQDPSRSESHTSIFDDIEEDVNDYSDSQEDDPFKDFADDLQFEDSEFDVNKENMIEQSDLDIGLNSFENNAFDEYENDKVIADTVKTMSELISKINEQKDLLAKSELRVDKLLDFKKKISDDYQRVSKDNISLKNRVKKLDEEVQSLRETIRNREDEIKDLKLQVEGKRELAKLVEDAQALLDDARSNNN